MAKLKDRPYDSSDLKELMDNIGGWAKSWDDAVWYIETVGHADADFAKKEVPALLEDLKQVKKDGAKFDTDYRKLYKAIEGKDCDGCPEPEGIESHGFNTRKLAEDVLEKLDYPVDKKEVIEAAKKKKAPDAAVQVLEKMDDKKFKDMGSLIESIGDVSWDHD